MILKEFNIASKHTPTSPTIATHIGKVKIIDKTINNTLTAIENTMFCLTVFIVFLDILIALLIEEILSSIITISLALIAISDPRLLIAIPQDELIKQAASLIPSPTYTKLVFLLIFSTIFNFFAQQKGTTRAIVWEKTNPVPSNGKYMVIFLNFGYSTGEFIVKRAIENNIDIAIFAEYKGINLSKLKIDNPEYHFADNMGVCDRLLFVYKKDFIKFTRC